MFVWALLDDNNRVVSLTDNVLFVDDKYIGVNLSDELDIGLLDDLCYDPDLKTIVNDGQYTDKKNESIKHLQENLIYTSQVAKAVPMFINLVSKDIDDKKASDVYMLFDSFEIGKEYTIGEIFKYEDLLYRVGQSHTSQAQWIPGTPGTESLYSKIEITEEGYEVWQEWDGVSGSYANGQIVKDPTNGQLYKSLIDNNVWGPPSTQPDWWQLYVES